MFKLLKEKFTSWFKKPEEKEEKKTQAKKEEKEKSVKAKQVKEKKVPKQKKEKEEELPKEKKVQEKIQKQKEQISEEKAKEPEPEIKSTPVIQEISSQQKEVQHQETASLQAEQKEGFFKKLFRKKKKEEGPTPAEETKKETPPTPETVTQQVHKESPIKPKEISQQEKVPEKEAGFFSKLASKLSTSTLTQEQFDEIFPELEITLLENNVALEVVDKIHAELSKDLVGIEVKKSQIQNTIITSLKETILSLLVEPPSLIRDIKRKRELPFTIIFVGINGSGKTTSVAKLAHYLKQHNIISVIAAADTFRAASIEQLEQHARNLDVPLVKHQYGADPAAVAFDAKKYAKAHNIPVVLIDTAGRMYTKTNLLKEMEKIVRVAQPDLKIFVGESITGNDATEQAKTFNEAINIDGVILTKADVDDKAGTILSVSHVTGRPIYFLGTGQSYADFTPFTKKEVLKNLGLET